MIGQFKKGDKVYFETGAGYTKNITGFGSIRAVRDFRGGGYYLDVSTMLSGPEDDKLFTEAGIIVEPCRGAVLLHESVYNSPLWKALSEEESSKD